jgi:hypothetical protein
VCHYEKCHYAECRYAKFHIFSSYALIGTMLCVIILNVSMMCATFYIVMLIGIMGESRSAECHILYLYGERCTECHFSLCHRAEYCYPNSGIFYCFGECRYAECQYDSCHYSEFSFAMVSVVVLNGILAPRHSA